MSAVSSVMTDIADTWAALTPPDRTEDSYQELDIRRSFAGNRAFYFDPPERGEPVGEAANVATLVEWMIVARLRLDEAGRSRADMARVCADEANLLMRAVDLRTSWTSPLVWGVITDDVTFERLDDDRNDVEVTLNMRALCAEE